MLTMQIWNASIVRVLKNKDHWDIVWDILSYWNTYKNKLGKFKKDKQSFFSKTNGSFGLGLLSFVEDKLVSLNIEYEIDKTIRKPIDIKIKEKVNLNNIKFEDYQSKLIYSITSKTYRGIFEVPTAGGKSIIAAGIIDRFNRPETLVFVPNKTILYGVHSEIEKCLNEPIGMVGDNIFKKEKITVGLYQSLRKYHKQFSNVKLAIVDEAHGVNNSIYDFLFSLTRTWYRFGLTGTSVSKSDRKKYLQNTAQLGPILQKITDKQAIKRVVPVEAYMFKFVKKVNIDKIKIFNKKGEENKSQYQSLYRSILCDEDRCELVVDIAKFCLEERKKKSCLILVDEYNQAKIIQEIAEYYFEKEIILCWSKTSTEEKFKIINNLSSGKIPIVIATPVFGVGTNIKGVESVVNGSIRKSSINILQKAGRGKRRVKGKDILLYCDIYDEINDENNEPTSITKFSIKRKGIYKRKGWLVGIY